jgi:rubredoxin
MIKIYRTREEYYDEHQVCPKCGSGTSSTYVGYIFRPERPFKDENRCECECGWKGIFDKLVKRRNKV